MTQKPTIVCVDNDQYKKHAEGYEPWNPSVPEDENQAPFLSLEATGIPELRSIITEFPADGRWEALKHHVHDVWDCMLNALELSGSVTKAQRKAEVDEKLRQSLSVSVTHMRSFTLTNLHPDHSQHRRRIFPEV